MIKDYYVGLDIGTNSVGWAVATSSYNLKRFNSKYMHGVRMFEAMSTAEARRMHRSARRRLNRRKDRLDQLQSYFVDEIKKVDKDFFVRLQEGFLQSEEQTVKRVHTLFDSSEYNDKDFYSQYKTIYHLREHLVNSTEKEDIRLIYLALHHIMKYRGHFLFAGSLNLDGNIKELLQKLKEVSENIFGTEVYTLDTDKKIHDFLNVLTNTNSNKTQKTKELKLFINEDIDSSMKNFEEVHKILSARKANLQKLFVQSELEEDISIEFDAANIDEVMSSLASLSDEEVVFVETLKGIYDWTVLQNILAGEKTISKAMVLSYEKHKRDLALLKTIIKEIGSATYKDFFNNVENKKSYAYFIKYGNQHQEELYKEIRKILKKAPATYKEEVANIDLEISNKTYLLKQRIPTNGIIPHQLHLFELQRILANASKHYDFLNVVDETKLDVKTKIETIFKFRIPYYIGPLNDAHKEDGFAWVVRKEKGKVYPWNFESKIDVEATSEAFIRRMTNKCSYILSEDVLPKSSLLYEKFLVLNEINNLKINGEDISVDMKQAIYKSMFVDRKINVSKKRIAKFVKDNYPEYLSEEIVVTGVDDLVKSKLKSLHDLKNIFEDQLPNDEVLENIILWSTLFSDEKSMFRTKIKREYPNVVTEEQLQRLEKLTFSGWGRLSRMMLENLLHEEEGMEPKSIIQNLYESNYNLMELLSSSFTYQEQIDAINNEELTERDSVKYDSLDNLNLPPNIKRPIWQTIRIMEEIKRTQKGAPRRIFIEMAREEGEKGKRTKSRKQQLLDFYKSLDNDSELMESLRARIPIMKERLDKETDDSLRKRKVFLYYKQLGRCMYTGETIHFQDLLNNTIYDIDHIYPRSETADDSLVNQVLVTKKSNVLKGDRYPLIPDWQKKQASFWYNLRKNNLIEQETYNRLIRVKPLTVDELSDFVARQLVETRQATKAIYNVLKQIYPDTEVITIKAQHIDRFRHDNEIVKVRSLNDLHHAKDAYLAVVVGNAYYERFTSNPRLYVKNAKKRDYNLTKILDTKKEGKNIVSRTTGELVWESGPNGTIKKVLNTLKNNDILTTYMIQERSGELFDQNPVKKTENRVPLYDGLPTEKYGGYHKASYSHYVLVERKQGKKIVRSIEPVLLHLKDRIISNKDLVSYLTNERGLIDAKVIIPYIPAVNVLLEYDGGRHRITGVSGDSFVMRNETQTYYDSAFVENFKVIDNIKSEGKLHLIKKLSKDMLVDMYIVLKEKMELKPHQRRLERFGLLLETQHETFVNLSVTEQVDVIWEVAKLLKSTRESSNLHLINGSKQAGVNTLGSVITNKESIYLVNQSVTGLYESKVDLLK